MHRYRFRICASGQHFCILSVIVHCFLAELFAPLFLLYIKMLFLQITDILRTRSGVFGNSKKGSEVMQQVEQEKVLELPAVISSKKDITLRDYQEECKEVLDSLDGGSHLVVMATGLGKTVVFSHMKRKGRMLILSHRDELVHQPQKYFDCSFGVEKAEETSDGEEVVSASVQSLSRRLDRFPRDAFDTIVTDEAHHAIAPSYRKIYSYFTPRLHVGFTATPNRADNAKLGEVFEDVIYERNLKWGIKNGYLCDVRCIRADIGYDLRGAKMQMGDFRVTDVEAAVDIEKANDAIAEIYREKAIGPTLIFAASVAHANNIASRIPGAEVVTATTPNRKEILEGFANGTVPVIVNCMVLTEGTDLPMIRTIMMCRPTRNAALFTQAVGRGTRLYEGKKELLLIDCTGASDLPVCTAPSLFNLNETDVKKADCEGKLLTEMEDAIEQMKAKEEEEQVERWKVRIREVNLFDNIDYETHGVAYTVCANGDAVCSIGDGFALVVTAENAVGKSEVCLYKRNKLVKRSGEIEPQKAFDKAFRVLLRCFYRDLSLWSTEKIQNYGLKPMTSGQRRYIENLGGFLEGSNPNKMTRYQAMCMINRLNRAVMLEE